MARERYAFGDFTLDVAERRVTGGGRELALQPKVHDLLVALLRRSGQLVTKQELLDAVWPGAFVEEGILAVHISGLRKALGDDRRSATYIQTVAKSGYRFIAHVESDEGSDATPTPPASITTAEVYERVGRARQYLLGAARADIPQAIAGFESAIAIDPAYAPAHAGLALALCAQADQRLAESAAAHARARVAALRALALDHTSADALVALGAVMFKSEWDWIGAERSLRRALELNPSHTEARLLLGHLLESRGRFDDGLSVKLRALEHDPFSPSVHLGLALSYWHQRRYVDSINWANKTLDLAPHHLLAREFLAGAYWAMGDFDRHMEENIRHAAAFGVGAETLESLRRAYALGGRKGVVRLALDSASARAGPAGGLPPVQLALFHSELGDLDQAITYLERAIETRDPCLVDLAVAPQWDALRHHPGFKKCLVEMNLVESGLAE